MKKVLSSIAIVALLLFVLAGCGSNNTTYATIGGKTKVTENDVNAYLKQMGAPDKVTADVKSKVIDQLVMIKLLDYVGTQKGYQTSKEYTAALAKQEPQVLSQVAYEKYIAGPSKVTDKDIQAAYDKQKAELLTPQQAEVSHIVVKTQAQAQALINTLSKQTGAALDQAFSAAAKKSSLDKTSGAKGGLIGTYSEDQTVGSYKAAIFGMKTPGVYAKPVKLGSTYSVIKVDKIIPAGQMTLAQAKPQLEQMLQTTKAEATMKQWQADAMKKYGTLNQSTLDQFAKNAKLADTAVIATVNGKDITVKDVNAAFANIPAMYRSQVINNPEMRTNIANEVIMNKLLSAAADKENLKNSPEFKTAFATVQDQLLASITAEKEIVSGVTVTDAQAQAFYKQYKSQINQPYAAVKDKIIAQIKQQQAGGLLQAWYQTNKAKYVKMNDKALPKLPAASGSSTTSGSAATSGSSN